MQGWVGKLVAVGKSTVFAVRFDDSFSATGEKVCGVDLKFVKTGGKGLVATGCVKIFLKMIMINKTLACLVGLGVSVSAFAIPIAYSDADSFGGLNPNNTPKGVFLGPNTFQNGTFDVATGAGDLTSNFKIVYTGAGGGLNQTYTSQLGFNPITQAVVPGSIAIDFWFRSKTVSDRKNNVEVKIGSLALGVKKFITNAYLSNGSSALDIEASIDSTGKVSYKVSSPLNSVANPNVGFFLDAAYLSLDADRIPDNGATLGMLGAAVLALEGVRRRFFRS